MRNASARSIDYDDDPIAFWQNHLKACKKSRADLRVRQENGDASEDTVRNLSVLDYAIRTTGQHIKIMKEGV